MAAVNGGADRFCSQARHCAIHPANSGAIAMARTTSPNWRTNADSSHRTNTSRAKQREKAVEQIDRKSSTLQNADHIRQSLHCRAQWADRSLATDGLQCEPGSAARCRTGDGRSRSMRKKRSEHVPDRLTEAFRRVLHAGGLPRITTIPCSRSAYAPVGQKTHQQEGHTHHADDPGE